MILDRARQLEILQSLEATYPDHDKSFLDRQNEEADFANLTYLQEHGLVNAALDRSLSGGYIFTGARITAKGLDFLADDGGLTAILGTVVVKLHSDTIRELLQQKITDSELSPEKKSWLMEQMGNLSTEALNSITRELVRAGIDNIPDLYSWVRAVVGPVS
jgi:hypothetical protein